MPDSAAALISKHSIAVADTMAYAHTTLGMSMHEYINMGYPMQQMPVTEVSKLDSVSRKVAEIGSRCGRPGLVCADCMADGYLA